MSTHNVQSAPFRQARFEDVPEQPRVPHPYASTRSETVQVASRAFGAMKVHVRVAGSGPPLLLIHGLMTSSYSWRYVLEPLGRSFTLYIPDLPGAGRTDAPRERLHPDAIASWIADLQRALGIRGCAVLANSMGGYLAMRLALTDPDSMSRLVNLHSPGVPEARLYALGAALAVPGTYSLFRWLVQRNVERWTHRNVHYFDESLKSLEEAREYGRPLATEDGVRALHSYLRDTMAVGPMRKFQRDLVALRSSGRPFPVPLMLMFAERDPMVPARFGDVFRERIPSARFVRLSDASHFAHVDAVERFVPPVLNFLTPQVD